MVVSADGIQRIELDEEPDVRELMAGMVPRTASRFMNRMSAATTTGLGSGMHSRQRGAREQKYGAQISSVPEESGVEMPGRQAGVPSRGTEMV